MIVVVVFFFKKRGFYYGLISPDILKPGCEEDVSIEVEG